MLLGGELFKLVEKAGGKAHGLRLLSNAGFSVPPWIVISSTEDLTDKSIIKQINHFLSMCRKGCHPHKTWSGRNLTKKGVHWQTQRTTTSLGVTNEPTRDILPEYVLSGKRSNWKREHPRSQPERQALYLRCLPGHIYNQQGYDFLSFAL